MIVTSAPKVMPCSAATFFTDSGSANNTDFAIPRSAQIAAALTVRGSSPSGNTMVLPALRAKSVNLKRNAAGEIRASRASGAEIAAANACASKALILPACAPNTPKMSVLFTPPNSEATASTNVPSSLFATKMICASKVCAIAKFKLFAKGA